MTSATMHAAVYHGPRDIRIEQVPVPEPESGQLLIEVSRNGICGSDLHTYVGASKWRRTRCGVPEPRSAPR